MRKLAIAVAGLGCLGSAWAQVTERVSVDSSGAQANGGGDLPFPPGNVMSIDGRFVAFISGASNLVPGDTNMNWDVFVHDRQTGLTERVSVDSAGAQGHANSGLYGVAISADGRFVAFESAANSLVPGDTNGARDIFLRDRLNGTTERVSLRSNGAEGNGGSTHPSLSEDGRYVEFASSASNLVPGDTNGQMDVFVRDRVGGTTELVSLSTSGVQSNGTSEMSSICANGRYVAFASEATNLVSGDTNGFPDVFVRDRLTGVTTRVSVGPQGGQGNGNSGWPWISADGRYVAFTSEASNLAPGDTNGTRDVFVRDLLSGTTTLVSVSMSGVPGNLRSQDITLSSDGRFAAFTSSATDLIPNNPTNLTNWVFVRDLQSATTELVSRMTDGSIPGTGGSQIPCISADGRYVAFESDMTALVPGDTNADMDVFLHDRFAAGFISLCIPGIQPAIVCPCQNPPSSTGRGCNNSSLTGGAALSAHGNAYLSIDSLVFTTRFETSGATSILLQGDVSLPTGVVFGQGVRCAGGTLKRMYVKTAVNGSITAPEIGDSTVSARSTQLGLPIQPGVPHYFLVYYRDSTVLGGCSSVSTFNATQTGSISWWP